MREPGANGLFAELGGSILLADSGSRVVARLSLANKKKTVLASGHQGKRFNSPNDLVRRANGVTLSPDEKTLYVSISDPKKPVWIAYALNSAGDVLSRRVFADAADLMGKDAPGLPDGIAMAADGHLFATGPGGVLIMTADGRRLGRIETGAAIANCTFGDDGRTLYMTSKDMLPRVRLSTLGVEF